MSNLTAYSALTTKIHAMHGHLLSDADFRELAACTSIAEAVSYLKQKPFYGALFSDLDETTLHREQIEQRLAQAIFYDFEKLYCFANQKQRLALLFLFQKYIPDAIRHCLYNISSGQTLQPQEAFAHPFFEKHADLALSDLFACTSIDELIGALSGTGYDIPLKTVRDGASPKLFWYEQALDMHYFSRVWKSRADYLLPQDLAPVEHALGSTMDLLNVQWIFRCKNYFHLAPLGISALLISVRYRLRADELRALTDAPDGNAFLEAIEQTYYGKIYRAYMPKAADDASFSRLAAQVTDKLCELDRRKNPYSIASVNAYLREKEAELSRIVTVMEGIRYALDTGEILRFIYLS